MPGRKIRKDDLRQLFRLIGATHRLIGPRLRDNAITLGEIGFEEIPAGLRDQQDRAFYRILPGRDPMVFSFSPGADSFKRYLHPPRADFSRFTKSGEGITVQPAIPEGRPLAFMDMRACDIAALRLQDKTFLEGPVPDPLYASLRKDIVIIGVNCLYPSGTCFCDSMGTGPEVTGGADVVITELREHFLLEPGTPFGEELTGEMPSVEVTEADREEKAAASEACRGMITKSMETGDLPGLLYRNLEHPRWEEIARRDLECGNCTQVCPTCFCNSVYDRVSPSGLSQETGEIKGVRTRSWDSCFSGNFARVCGGNFRPSRRARYRHWMTHKLAYWIDQFGASGCVGCGRCITWCPARIDITEELRAIRGKE